ncbi:MAG TPA: hypothetical protein VMW66_02535 [Elusimicrobiales bacterium]|nr:hypothetical protein [Elusimicrobiales bacterium]
MRGFVLDTPALNVYEHMAFDELKVDKTGGDFILRFYNWAEAGVTFGYAQNCDYVMKNIPLEFKDVSVVRRPTGGGVVFHKCDLTFSCIFPSQSSLRPMEIYSKIHQAVYAGLLERKIPCKPCLEEKPSTQYMPELNGQAAQCFVNPVKFDLVTEDGKKILGGAVRKFKDVVLYQGSLQIDDARQKQPELETAIIKAIADKWGIAFQRENAENNFITNVRELAKSKYQTKQWFEKL